MFLKSNAWLHERGYADFEIIQMWKNKHVLVSAKKPKHKNKDNVGRVKGPDASLKGETEV